MKAPYFLEQTDELNLFTFLENTAKKFPTNPALCYVDEEYILYKDFHKKALELALCLRNNNIEFGDRVAIWSENGPNWLIAYFATISIGAVAVPVLPDFSAKEASHILEHSGAKISFLSVTQARKLKTANIAIESKIVLISDFTVDYNEDFVGQNAFCIATEEELKDFKLPKVVGSDLASIIYTSGTTGTSKGVMLTHKNLTSNSIQGWDTYGVDENDRFLSILPMSHSYEFTLGNIYGVMCGASLHYIKKPPTASVLMPALKSVRPTLMFTVPLIMDKIFKSKIRPELTNSPLKRFLYGIPFFRKLLHRIAGKKLYSTFGGQLGFFGIGGAKLDEDVDRFLHEAKFPYAIGYGLTETSPLLAGAKPGTGKVGSTGPTVLGATLKLRNIDPKTGEGEVIAYGPNIMKGYYKADDLNKEVFTEDGGFITGDTGIFDKDNFLYIKGRIKNMILGPSGENIFPEEIEAQINKSEWVLESLVYELKGKVVARVELNNEEIQKQFSNLKDKTSEMEKNINDILVNIRKNVNDEVNKFSKLSNIFEQKEPFVKTPTKKIKRYLYNDKDAHENPEEKNS
ncbi:MAG: AMP-binding protein [Bacteroidales bacterium]|nr:AMP-binding protein [Bacteroidales bacterium]